MANKKVYMSECCVITNDDKGQCTLVGKAKEALTTLSKNKIDVTILTESADTEAIDKFLKENSVPFKDLKPWADMKKDQDKHDALLLGENNVVLLRSDWQWALDDIVQKLYGGEEKKPHVSEQQKMDEKFKDYKHWADEAAKAKKKHQEGIVSAG